MCRGAGALGCAIGYVRECSAKRGGIAKRTRREGVLLSIVFHNFCQLPDCLKGLGCTIPFIHCSPTFTIRRHGAIACHFLFQRILPRHHRPPLSSLPLVFPLCQRSLLRIILAACRFIRLWKDIGLKNGLPSNIYCFVKHRRNVTILTEFSYIFKLFLLYINRRNFSTRFRFTAINRFLAIISYYGNGLRYDSCFSEK